VLQFLADDLPGGVVRECLLQDAESLSSVDALNGGIEGLDVEEL
jgi:hypothetical protein